MYVKFIYNVMEFGQALPKESNFVQVSGILEHDRGAEGRALNDRKCGLEVTYHDVLRIAQDICWVVH